MENFDPEGFIIEGSKELTNKNFKLLNNTLISVSPTYQAMMKLTVPFPDFNLSNLPNWAMGYLLSKGMDYLLKNRKKIFRHKNLGKNFGWFQIGTLAICFIASYKVKTIFEKIHAKPLVTIMDNNLMQILKLGFRVLKRIEPDLALFIYKKLEAFVRVYEVGKITGVYDWDSVIRE